MRKRGTKSKTRKDTIKKKKVYKKKVRNPKVPRTRNGGTMTEADFFNKLRTSLRRAFRFWVPMRTALMAVERPYTGPNKLQKHEYQCAQCKKWFKRTQVQIDHIIPCGTLRSYDDIVPFIKNLTQEDSSSYQVLCKDDHKAKTKKEANDRSNGDSKAE